MKKWFAFVLLIATAVAAHATLHQEDRPVKLINSKTGFVVVMFKEQKAYFTDPTLQAQMQERGITIPPLLRGKFREMATIKLGDPDFQRAFEEVYYPLSMNKTGYHWEKED